MTHPAQIIGRRARRQEDPALLQGAGRFVDDIPMPGVLHAAFVRSSLAHARLGAIDIDAALALPGVVACYTASTMAGLLTQPRLPIAFPQGQLGPQAMPFVLPES